MEFALERRIPPFFQFFRHRSVGKHPLDAGLGIIELPSTA